MAFLEIRDGGFEVDNVALLGPLDLSLECSGITAILGPNGAGKSLFLSLCHGTLDKAQGHVSWDGTPAETTRGARGFMAQQVAILRRSVFDNVAFALQARDISSAEQALRVTKILDQVRLSDHAKTPAAALSGGELRRMSLARALVSNPALVLMDEPSAGLDPASSKELEEMVCQAAKSGISLLMVIHDIGQARRLAKHVLFFSNGQLVENATANSFFACPKTAAAQAYLKGRLE